MRDLIDEHDARVAELEEALAKATALNEEEEQIYNEMLHTARKLGEAAGDHADRIAYAAIAGEGTDDE